MTHTTSKTIKGAYERYEHSRLYTLDDCYSSYSAAKENAMDAKFRIRMIRFELAMIDRTRFIFVKQFYVGCIKPIFAGISILLKYIVVIPFGRLIAKLFPKFAQKVQEEHKISK